MSSACVLLGWVSAGPSEPSACILLGPMESFWHSGNPKAPHFWGSHSGLSDPGCLWALSLPPSSTAPLQAAGQANISLLVTWDLHGLTPAHPGSSQGLVLR